MITAKATLAPVHVNAADLDAAAAAGRWLWPSGVVVVARVVVGADLGAGRFAIGDAATGWIIEVPRGTPGAAAIAAGAAAWIVVADPRFDAGRMTVTARDAEPRYVAAP
ncbi:MAG: hypothetical protein IPL61_17170 [Myxococcales bacterium]|nr:hypothetical protein [Myxococcales bacterium]